MIMQPKISVFEDRSGVTCPTAVAIGASPPLHKRRVGEHGCRVLACRCWTSISETWYQDTPQRRKRKLGSRLSDKTCQVTFIRQPTSRRQDVCHAAKDKADRKETDAAIRRPLDLQCAPVFNSQGSTAALEKTK